MSQNMTENEWDFDLLKAFGYIESVVKSDFFFSQKRPILQHTCASCSELASYISIPWIEIQYVKLKNVL